MTEKYIWIIIPVLVVAAVAAVLFLLFRKKRHFGEMDDMDIVSRTFPAEAGHLDEVADFVNSVAQATGPDAATLMKIDVCIEEIFINICYYAFPESAGTVLVETAASEGIVAVRFTDSGIPFNPMTQEAPDLSVPVSDQREGGLGIVMVKGLMDYVGYEYKDGNNIFTMKKRVG